MPQEEPLLIFSVRDCTNRYTKKGPCRRLYQVCRTKSNEGVQISPEGSSVLFHGEDFDHVVGVIPHLCLAEPGNAEVTFTVNIGKIL